MSKFLQLAEDIEADFAELDKDADSLNERRLAVKERARVATNAHHKTYDRVEEGLDRLEQAAGALGAKSNSAKAKAEELAGKSQTGEGSGDTSDSSFSKG